MSPAPGPTDGLVGPYRLIEKIGHGGQGDVYCAEDTRTGQHVALKVLTQRAAMSLPAIERFQREAEVTSKLSHPGICPIYEVGLDGEVPYIAMKLIDGETLAKRISRASADSSTCVMLPETGDFAPPAPEARINFPPGHIEVMRIVEVFERAALAVHAAHEAGVLHRDLKPGNMMVTPDGEPVILDFGLAEELDSENPTLTISGDLLGTLHYMSPEQIAAKRIRLDRRTDVWSLGAALYEALTLKKPFESPTRDGLLQAILAKEPVGPRQINRAIPTDLRTVIETALEKDRDRRYATALDFAEDLRRVHSAERILAKPASWAIRLRRWAKRNPALATGAAGLLAVFLTGLTVLFVMLAETRRERDGKTAALADYDRLGDASRLETLTAEADDLRPCEPAKVADMRGWIERGSELEKRLPGHTGVLARLRQSGTQVAPSSRAGESRATSRPTWRFERPADQFKHDTTAKLVADLTMFVDPDPHKGLLADVRSRLAFAESVEHETLVKYEDAWKRAIDSIAVNPRYHGLRVKPQLGLIPIGEDPNSHLWEFVHLQTATRGTDPIPKRGQDSRLIVTQGMGIIFVLLPGGTFRMGAVKEPPDEDTPMSAPNVDPEAEVRESPVTEISLEPFFLSKYEMTQGQWQSLVGNNPSQYGPGTNFGGNIVDLRNPVEYISWEDCDVWLGRLALVIPTEAQWESASRGGTTTPRWTGIGTDGLDKAANLADQFCKENGGSSRWKYEPWNDGYTAHAPVGSFAPNPFGLHDVLGNVWEWCRDWYCDYELKPRPGDGLRSPPARSPSATRSRVFRSGGWNTAASSARSAARVNLTPAFRDFNLGVRPARRLDP